MRVRVLIAVVALLAVSACTYPLAAPVAFPHHGPRGLRDGAVLFAERAEAAARAAELTVAVTPVDPAPYLGRPLHRAPFPTDEVAITLDDGPSAHTAEVLDIFDRLGVKATFFWVGGRTRGHEAEVARAYRSGFEIGDHTWDHQEIAREPLAFDLSEIDRCQRQIAGITGSEPLFVRPVSGHWDENTLKAADERGMVLALWSLHGQDTGPGTHAATIARGVIGSARGGDIILLHETNPETVQALPTIVEGLRAKGLKPVTLSQLLTR